MKNTIIFVFFISSVTFFSSCSNDKVKEVVSSVEESKQIVITKDASYTIIKELEKTAHSSVLFNDSLGKAMVKAYSDYANAFPTDTFSPDFLFKAAEVSTALKDYQHALNYYETITNNYPNYKYCVESLFLQAHIYDDFLNQDDKAKIVYEQLIAKYPTHKFAEDSKIMIKNLGKSDEELIKEFKKKNNEKSSANRQPRLMFPSFIVADNTTIS
jgi:TolA-binding protein